MYHTGHSSNEQYTRVDSARLISQHSKVLTKITNLKQYSRQITDAPTIVLPFQLPSYGAVIHTYRCDLTTISTRSSNSE